MFIPRPTDEDEEYIEDDGVILTVLTDGEANESYLIVVDARTMTEIARAQAPQTIPAGFHGTFVQS